MRLPAVSPLLLAALSLAAVPCASPAERPTLVYSVEMRASYEPATARLRGSERLRWRNTTAAPVGDLQFHLYLNAFASTRTTFARESAGELRGMAMPDGKWGFIDVSSLRLADGTDLKPQEEFLAPDDANADDRTVARYPLPRPLPPGGQIEVAIEFEAQLPGVFARTGAHGDYVLGGQWFPKIAVFEDAGVHGRAEAGWNCHQYHANSEFYADFGDYDVTLDLPARYAGRIGATGRLVEEDVSGARVRARFRETGVHDFAWVADPRFVVVTDRFDPARDVPRGEREEVGRLLGVEPGTLRLSPVDIRLLLQPADRAQAGRYLASAKLAFATFGLLLAPYPWSGMTLVDPSSGAMGSGGMEYPTLVTLGTHPALALPGLRGVRAPEMVTIHEIGHNWFQGMSASNEFEEAWLDEGVTSYYETLAMDRFYPALVEAFGAALSSDEQQRLSVSGGHFSDPIVLDSWRYRSNDSYGAASYGRAAATLRQLENLVGRPTFHRAMRRFFAQARFSHPTTADFERVMQEQAGRDLGWFFSQALHSTAVLDLAVREVRSEPRPSRRGVFWRDGRRLDVDAAAAAKPGRGGRAREYLTAVVVERRGEFRHPTEVELVFEDGSRQRRSWDGQQRWARFELVGPSRLRSATVDPDHRLVLDVDRLNNGRLLEPDPRPARLLLARLLAALQLVISLSGVLA